MDILWMHVRTSGVWKGVVTLTDLLHSCFYTQLSNYCCTLLGTSVSLLLDIHCLIWGAHLLCVLTEHRCAEKRVIFTHRKWPVHRVSTLKAFRCRPIQGFARQGRRTLANYMREQIMKGKEGFDTCMYSIYRYLKLQAKTHHAQTYLWTLSVKKNLCSVGM